LDGPDSRWSPKPEIGLGGTVTAFDPFGAPFEVFRFLPHFAQGGVDTDQFAAAKTTDIQEIYLGGGATPVSPPAF
jgi:hypothetical protein